MLNEDLPLEAVLKYIKRDRDKYKAKLERLIPYTKSLEERLERASDARFNELIKENVNLKSANDGLKKENAALRAEYRKSGWFIGLEKRDAALAKENAFLKQELIRLRAATTNKANNDTKRD